MGFFDNIMLQFDQGLTGLFGQWNMYSTALATLLAVVFTFGVVTSRDPDIHPMALARQAWASNVRQEGESALYRSAILRGGELHTGLDVKEPGASKWSRGKDGDLRDVWRRVVAGKDGEGKGMGRILTVFGVENVVEHRIDDLTRQINLIGAHISHNGGIRIAIYLPNSVELLTTLLACAFYPNLTTILIPFDVPPSDLLSMLRRSAADTVVTAPGFFPFDAILKSYPALRQLIWVVDEGSAHMDWNEVPQGAGGAVNVATWTEILNDAPVEKGREVLGNEKGEEPKDVVVFWQGKPGTMEEMVRFSQKNLVAGIAAHLAGVPTDQAIGPSDLFLPADSLTHSYTLTLTLAALYSNASVAFNSVAGKGADLILATQGVAPTVIVASPEQLLKTHRECSGTIKSALSKAAHWFATRDLSQKGVLPISSFLSSLGATRPRMGTKPGKLRLVYVADRAGADSPPLTSRALSDLRIFLGARVIHGLTAAKVAGAVAQTWYYDYRLDASGGCSHFGPPVTSVEVLLRDKEQWTTDGEKCEGEIIARGPCVSGGEAALGVVGRIREDNTLAYV